VLDKAEYTAFESMLNSPIVSYRIPDGKTIRTYANNYQAPRSQTTSITDTEYTGKQCTSTGDFPNVK